MSRCNQFKLRIKPQYSFIVHHPNAIELRSGVWNPTSYMINDDKKENILYKIIAALDGRYSIDEISKTLHIKKGKIESVINHLNKLGVIETEPSTAYQEYIDQVSPGLRIISDKEAINSPK